MNINTSRLAKDWRHKTLPLQRKRLSDITNFSAAGFCEGIVNAESANGKIGSPVMANEYIATLLKENNVLMRALAERNTEVQNLRMNLAKLAKQNWQFAQAHSQMLAEFNLGKDRLKAAQHELGCTSTALKVKTQQLEEQKKLNKQNMQMQNTTNLAGRIKPTETAVETLQLAPHERTCLPNRKRLRSQSLAPLPATNQITTEENRRKRPLRRKSIVSKAESCVPTEDLFEIGEAKFPLCSGDNKGEEMKVEGCSSETAVETSQLVPHERTCLPNRKRLRSQSLAPLPTTNQITTEEENQSRKRPLRRKSIISKAESCVPTEDLFEIEDAKFPLCSGDNKGEEMKVGGCSFQPKPSSAPTIPIKSVKEEVEEIQVSTSLRRTSLGRPLRRAAEKVDCYKELPINAKQRRPE